MILKTNDERLNLLANRPSVVAKEVSAYLKANSQDAGNTTLSEMGTLADHLSSQYREFVSRKDIMGALDSIIHE